MELNGKKIIVVGLGKSGLESARFLFDRGARVLVSEKERSPLLDKRAKELQDLGIEVELGKHGKGIFKDADYAIFSPGIAPGEPIFQEASSVLGKRLISEIELAYRFCPSEIVAITGTNGKSSVTAWTAQLLSALGHPAIACGNIGNPFIGEISKLNAQTKVVLEVSSFQLATIKSLKPFIGVILNLTPDHFDWHKDWDEYVRMKMRLFENQTASDYAVLNFRDSTLKERASSIRSRVIYFNKEETPNSNWDAVSTIASIYGIDKKRAMEVLSKLPTLAHRLEPVASNDGLHYINDSKATNPASLEWALERQPKRVILLCGGRNKGTDFSFLRYLIAKKVKRLVLFGESKHVLEKAWPDIVPVSVVNTLEEAIDSARKQSEREDTILLSPACSSFDQFKNYKHRGDIFKSYITQTLATLGHNLSGSGNRT